jgi:alkanesulfonate monooxygenase SsuD/methylene tetrahydromethanopterin reductase-like flavin-dependent oxidoreductase (luciferase family)
MARILGYIDLARLVTRRVDGVEEGNVRYGFVIPGGDVLSHIEMAQQIEAAGWDGVFLAEGIYGTDPWVSLAAIAVRTEQVRIGTLLTPPSRRRPWKLASEAATLDRLSGGRVILSVGLGAIDTGFAMVGEVTDRKVRAELLDESLEIITRLWSGQPFSFQGQHYHVNWDATWSYTPVQSPRIPIWVVGAWPRAQSMRRALRWDGLLPTKPEGHGAFAPVTPDDVRAMRAFVADQRPNAEAFDIVIEGVAPADDPEQAAATVRPFAEAGATWWIESMWDVPGGLDAVRMRIEQGPPRAG